jgi:glycosyltransferase involved in cell wall biosynthesis
MPFVLVVNPERRASGETLRLCAPANVTFLETVPPETMPALFRGALAFLSTSAFEGFPNTFLEAGKFRVPIVSLEVDPEGFLEEGGAGLRVGDDVAAAAAALRRLRGDPEEARRMGEAGRKIVARRHDLGVVVARMDRILQGTEPEQDPAT